MLVDVESALVAIASIGSKATRSLQSLTIKHDLLVRLLDDEHMRLHVWLTPLDHEPRRLMPSLHSHNSVTDVSIVRHTNSQQILLLTSKRQLRRLCSRQLGPKVLALPFKLQSAFNLHPCHGKSANCCLSLLRGQSENLKRFLSCLGIHYLAMCRSNSR